MSYGEVVERIGSAAGDSGRDPSDITLVAVSKAQSVEDILTVYGEGHRDFGENRAQEMAEKAGQLPDDIRWHFVGALQSRKAKTVKPFTHLLHSMDRPSLASAWTRDDGETPPTLVQVNVGEEEQKAGVAPEGLRSAVEQLLEMGVVIKGLMAIPPIPEQPEDSRRHFAALREMRDSLVDDHPEITELSMGMTDDFEVAISEGASIIRVGRAIFGPRKNYGA